jgi:alpha-tubulin suppressor-like RCC1 family protein
MEADMQIARNSRARLLCQWLWLLIAAVLLPACSNGGGGDPEPAPAPPVIVTPPGAVSVPEGSTATFSVVASGSALSYQWKKGSTNIASADGASYTTPPNALSNNGDAYSVVISNSAGTATSAAAVLTVRAVAPLVVRQPAPVAVTAGQVASFQIEATGSAPLAIQWMRSGAAIVGANSARYSTPATQLADDGATFSATVANAAGTATSASADLRVTAATEPPSIVSMPQSLSVNVGQTASFSVTAAGTGPLVYQWKKLGVNLAGATAASYSLVSAALADSGSTWAVTVSNAAGSVTSAAAVLTVLPPAPNITSQPSDVNVVAGQPAVFNVIAAGSGTLSYLWRRGGVPIAGATQPSYTLATTAQVDNGATFSVDVTNTGGTLSSAVATLRVTQPAVAASIAAQPQTQSVTVGQSATFSVTASGTPPFSFAWQKNGSPIAGASAASYTTPATALSDNGALFRVVVNNAVGVAATSNAVSLTVSTTGPSITTQPLSTAVLVGRPATFTVVATGTNPLTFKWRRNGADITNETGASYSIARTTFADHNAAFSVLVRDAQGAVVSNNASLNITPIGVESAHLAANGTVTRNVDGSLWLYRKAPGLPTSSGESAALLFRDSSGFVVTGYSKISVGRFHALAVDAQGRAWSFGDGTNGVLGNGSTGTPRSDVPVQVVLETGAPLARVRSIQAGGGGSGSYALMDDGTVMAWGVGGTLGIGNIDTVVPYPRPVVNALGSPITQITRMSAGVESGHTLALRADGTLWVWGSPGCLCLTGDGVTQFSRVALQVQKADGSPILNPRSFTTGSQHTAVVQPDGTVLTWGSNSRGQLGDATNTLRNQPVLMRRLDGTAFDGVAAVAAGINFTILLRTDGTVWAAGYNAAGSLGDGSSSDRNSPVQVFDNTNQPLTGVVEISAGNYGVAVKKADGTFWEWGDNTGNFLNGFGTSGVVRLARRITVFAP